MDDAYSSKLWTYFQVRSWRGVARRLGRDTWHWIFTLQRGLRDARWATMCRLSPPSFAYRDTQSLQINQLKLFKSSRKGNFTCANLLSVRSHKKPDGWSLLGDNKVQMARETLFHFCARLGLVKFIRLLFSKVRDFQRSIYSKKNPCLSRFKILFLAFVIYWKIFQKSQYRSYIAPYRFIVPSIKCQTISKRKNFALSQIL